MNAPYSAKTIAEWFIAWAGLEDADLSNLKLQKLLYYAQGHHLAKYETPLFSDQIEAWSHGPVVPSIYRRFKAHNSSDIRLSDSDGFRWDQVDEDTSDFLMQVWNTYGEFGAWKLRNMTHEEKPWADHFSDDKRGIVIPMDSIEKYFKAKYIPA